MQKGLAKSNLTDLPARLRDPNIAPAIERHIRRVTRQHINMLHVSVANGRVILHGQSDSSYYTELAMFAAMDVIGRRDPELIELNIQCRPTDGHPLEGRFAISPG